MIKTTIYHFSDSYDLYRWLVQNKGYDVFRQYSDGFILQGADGFPLIQNSGVRSVGYLAFPIGIEDSDIIECDLANSIEPLMRQSYSEGGYYWLPISDLAIVDNIDASAIHVLLPWTDFIDEIDG